MKSEGGEAAPAGTRAAPPGRRRPRAVPPVVRPATRHDLPGMAVVWRQMMAEHEALHAAFALADDAAARWLDATEQMLGGRESFVLLAERGYEVLGFCTGRAAHNPEIYAMQRVGLICELAVAQGARRAGVGAALVAAARTWFADRALDEFQLSTALANAAGRKFWRAMGGEELLVRYRFTPRGQTPLT